MLVIDQAMQQKLSNSWKLGGIKSEYEDEMAEDGDGPGVTSTSSPSSNGSVNSNVIPSNDGNVGPGSIVNSLLLKKTGSYFGGETSPGSGLEQKIKELKAEKEATTEEVDKKCNQGSADDQDSPIDFSVRRRSSFSGSLTDDSQGSSCSPPNTGDYRGMSPSHDFTNTINPDVHDSDVGVKHEVDNFYEDQKPDAIGQLNGSTPPVSNMPSLLKGIGALPGMPPSFLTNDSPTMNNFSQVISAATKMNEQHRNNRKNSRPFKAYPKEALQLPLGFLGMPGFNALQQGLDSGIFAGMSSDEIMTLYNQQLQLFKEKQLSSSNNCGNNSPPSQISSTTSSINGGDRDTNGHPNQQHHTINNPPNSLNHKSPPISNSNSTPKRQSIHSPGLEPPPSSYSPPLSNNSHDQNSPPHYPSHLHHHNNINNHNHHHHQPHHPTNNASPDHLKSDGLTTSSSNTASSMINITNNINNHHNNPFSLPPPLPHLPNNSPIHASSNHNLNLNSNGLTTNGNNSLVSSTSSSSPFNLHNQSNSQRKRPRSLPDDQKDDAYWERRRKNNDAAKRSRDARRAKEDEIALRAALLEQENLKLRVEVAALKTETARLRCMLYNT